MQSPKPPAIGRRERKAADHQLFATEALDLDPIAAAAGDIRPIAALGDDPFQPKLARLTQEPRAVVLDVVAVLNRRQVRLRQELTQSVLPLLQRQTAQIVPVEV